MRLRKKCSIDDCDNKAWARGWCNTHYTRWHRHGSPHVLMTNKRPACGTNHGHLWHTRNSEEPCEPCVTAHLSKCGSLAGRSRHLRADEPVCDRCKAANQTYRDNLRKVGAL